VGTEFNTNKKASPTPPADSQENAQEGKHAISGYGEIALAPDAEPSPQPEPAKPIAQSAPEPQSNPAWEKLSEEIHRTHLYANKNLHVGTVAREVLTGIVTPAQRDWLADKIGTNTVTLADNRTDLVWDIDPNPHHMVAVGNALSGFKPNPVHNQIIPEEFTKRRAPVTLAPAATALAICLFTLTLMGLWSDARALSDQRQHVAGLKHAISRIQASPMGNIPTEDTALEAALTSIPRPFPGSAVLAVLGNALPANARLESLEAEWHGQWTLEVNSTFNTSPVKALRQMGELVKTLHNSALFEQVTLMPVRAANQATSFRLNLTIKAEHALPS
jgi:hypothetical protein